MLFEINGDNCNRGKLWEGEVGLLLTLGDELMMKFHRDFSLYLDLFKILAKLIGFDFVP